MVGNKFQFSHKMSHLVWRNFDAFSTRKEKVVYYVGDNGRRLTQLWLSGVQLPRELRSWPSGMSQTETFDAS